MRYEDALREWGARQLPNSKFVDRSTVQVTFGYESDGHCDSCAYTTAGIEVFGKLTQTVKKNQPKYEQVFLQDPGMATIVREIGEIAEEFELLDKR